MKIDKLFSDAADVSLAESSRERARRIAAMLEEDGHPVPVSTVRKWSERRTVPTPWLVRITASAAKRGRQINLAEYT